MKPRGRVGTRRADLVEQRQAPGTVLFTCRANPEFRLLVRGLDGGQPEAEGYAADSSGSTAGGAFAVSARGTSFRVDHSSAMWFWLEFTM